MIDAAGRPAGERATDAAGVSVCIPAVDRIPTLLACVASTLSAAVRPLEIVVSDDCYGAPSVAALAAVALPDGVVLRHVPGARRGSQAANVNNAFRAATHERLVLMHDDDFFLPGGIDALVRAFGPADAPVDAAFGWQRQVDAAGRTDVAASEANRRAYGKLAPAGPQRSATWSALMGQFPNNGAMIRRSLALAAPYPDEAEVGRRPVDYHFGLRYAALARHPFVLLHEEISAYRAHPASISARGRRPADDYGHLGYEALRALPVEGAAERVAKAAALDRAAGAAVLGYIAADRPRAALATLLRHLPRMSESARSRCAMLAMAGLLPLVPAVKRAYFDRP
jgi:glycosyltransferase involved in cell wall biosynthesis